MVPLNILDYVLIDEGFSARDALLQTTELAKLADELGYHRHWVPEQHQAFSIASSSPEMIIMYLASAKNTYWLRWRDAPSLQPV
ncbi:hypothetical protein [Oceanobacillus zhaokaii]|uniref:hypothetical protein n=1 Tax=Oceanobacillus zhaokaii TaxID=2052660 RepID=UPI0026BF4E66